MAEQRHQAVMTAIGTDCACVMPAHECRASCNRNFLILASPRNSRQKSPSVSDWLDPERSDAAGRHRQHLRLPRRRQHVGARHAESLRKAGLAPWGSTQS